MVVPEGLQRAAPPIARVLARHPDLLPAVLAGELPGRAALVAEAWALAAAHAGDTAAMARALRRLKYRVVGALILADLRGGPDVVDLVGATLADLADALLEGALRFTDLTSRARLAPPDEWPESGGFVIIAMGKHGARELNYSSDIDLVFVARTLEGEAQPWADRLGRGVMRLLSEITEDGFCFRVDLNLRPDGVAGAQTSSLLGAEHYFLTFGRTWERAAWLKARSAAGDHAVGEELLTAIEPFRFRRHLDFGTLHDLAAMRDRIAAAARQDSLARDLKRGPGGIRAVEFLVQATVLAWCGRDRSLRVTGTVPGLRALQRKGGVLPQNIDADALIADYRLLRAVEHRLQWENEAQTQRLPAPDDLVAWGRLAWLLDAPDATEAQVRVEVARERIEAAFHVVFAGEDRGDDTALIDPFTGEDERVERLAALGFADPAAAAETLRRLASPGSQARMRPSTWRRFERVAPRLATLAARSADPDAALVRIGAFVERVGARGTTYELLHENPAVAETLVRLFAESAFLSERFLAHPELLDALVLRGQGGEVGPRDEAAVAAELHEELDARPAEDDRLLTLRTRQTVELLRIGLADLGEALPPDGSPHPLPCRHLTALAGALCGGAERLATEAMVARHGRPSSAGTPTPRAIVGLGSLGSGWMTYGSDLDLVFVHGADADDETDGARPLDPRTWHARQAQRTVTALTAPTREGRCYDVDLRLRPGGGSGAVVVSLPGLRDWYRDRAALWERLVVCRARVVWASDPGFGAEVATVLAEAITAPEGAAALVAEARAMRRRQRDERAGETATMRNIKTGVGGLTDVEFAVACLQATRPADHPTRGLADPLAALRALVAAGDVPEAEAAAVDDAYRFFRRVESTLRLRTGTEAARLDLASSSTARVAAALGLGDRDRLGAALNACRDIVGPLSDAWLARVAAGG